MNDEPNKSDIGQAEQVKCSEDSFAAGTAGQDGAGGDTAGQNDSVEPAGPRTLAEKIRAAQLRFRKNVLENPKYKMAQRIVWSVCIIWAVFVLADSIPYLIYINQGQIAFKSANYDEAEEMFRAAMVRSAHYDDGDLRKAHVLNNLGELYRTQARYEEAQPIYDHLLAIAQWQLAPKADESRPWTKITVLASKPNKMQAVVMINNTAAFYRDKGDYQKSEQLFGRAVSIWENDVKKPNDPGFGGVLNAYGKLYKDMGKYDRAEPLIKRALAIKENNAKGQVIQMGGNAEVEVAVVLDTLGGLYREQGRYKESEECYRKALQIDLKILGQQHPDVATDQNNLAGLLRDCGRWAESERLYIAALNMRRLLLGQDHPHTAKSYLGLGELYREANKPREAERLAKEALAIDKRVFKKADHQDMASCLNSLAGIYRLQGRLDDAQKAIDQCLVIRRKLLHAQHPDLAVSLCVDADIKRDRKQYADAARLYEQAIKIQEKVLGANHPALATSLNGMGLTLAAEGKRIEAKKLFEQSLEIRKRSLDKSHPAVAEVEKELRDLHAGTRSLAPYLVSHKSR